MPLTEHSLSLDNPVHECDPASETYVEAANLRRHGHVVPVVLFGGVRTWITTSAEASRTIMETNPDICKDPANWAALQRGEIPESWPFLSLLTEKSMFNTDGANHLRLRRLVSHAFTHKRIATVVPRLTAIADELLDALPDNGPVDLKTAYAYPLPMRTICEFFGITDPDEQDELRDEYATMFDAVATPDERTRAVAALEATLVRHIEDKHRHPDDRLTSTLIHIHEQDGDRLTEQELLGTLHIILAAGHETTVNAIINTVVALLTHPDQLALLRGGHRPWSSTVDAGLRWNVPLKCVYMRYALRDTNICGTVVPAGEPIATMIAGAQRNSDPVEARFDLTHDDRSHIGFGAGPHFCLGAPLARQEITIGLERLFTRYPNLRLAVEPEELTHIISPAINGLATLPLHLT